MENEKTFCFETVFSDPSKIDFIADAKAQDYEIILVLIHLDDPSLNIARVAQRVDEGGHSVPEEKIAPRIERLEENVRHVIALGIATQVHVLDNSDYNDPYVRVLSIVDGTVIEHLNPLPSWATKLALAAN